MATYSPKKNGHSYDNNVLIAAHIGMTVGVFQRSEQVMSDIFEMFTYAVCYDAATDSFKNVYVNSDYGTTAAYAEIDAEPELMVRYAEWKAEQEAMGAAGRFVSNLREELESLHHIQRGRMIRVVRGRKVAKGTEGRVFWYGESRYGMRIGIETSTGERIFVDGRNIEVVVDPAEVATIENDYAARAVEQAAYYHARIEAARNAEAAKYAAKAA